MNWRKELLPSILPLDEGAMLEAQRRLDSLTKPKHSLGRLEDFAKKAAGITGNPRPCIKNKVIFTMAGDHGVAGEGVSLFPQEVTGQMIYNFLEGGAGVNVLARHAGARVVIADIGCIENIKTGNVNFIDKKIARGTGNIAGGSAMSEEQAIASLRAGMEIFEGEYARGRIDIAGLGEMGIANTTSASAITCCITGAKAEDVTGRGTGIDDQRLKLKTDVVKKAVRVNNPDPHDPLDVLKKLGGFEIGALAGVIIAGAAKRVPVVIDGFITASAALIAAQISPLSRDYLFASHDSVEKGHAVALKWMGLAPMFDLQMRLGEGTGACIGISLIEAGTRVLNEMATFDGAGISREKE
ncbi:MAG: nicotinate-nucleotide--dimethylbenzimidazole phosphoribosyltransferase [Candidatus Omnitrophica bacterium]|nr:nicotinate-nucleotide--dimethylbenzimidazole phosphoribosyltransferase [Candidatus Omnitrophota bacterium]MDD5500926.1 nicotinate-nucleotide--dimethylbenzimidazole phosphoribosyltransferase [Candidatus Omnitrophota bacterium]